MGSNQTNLSVSTQSLISKSSAGLLSMAPSSPGIEIGRRTGLDIKDIFLILVEKYNFFHAIQNVIWIINIHRF